LSQGFGPYFRQMQGFDKLQAGKYCWPGPGNVSCFPIHFLRDIVRLTCVVAETQTPASSMQKGGWGPAACITQPRPTSAKRGGFDSAQIPRKCRRMRKVGGLRLERRNVGLVGEKGRGKFWGRIVGAKEGGNPRLMLRSRENDVIYKNQN